MKKILLSFLFLANTCFAGVLEIVVPVPPGGPVDNAARVLQQQLMDKQKINSVVLYKPGGDGQVASKYFLNNQSNKVLMVSTTTSLMLKLTNKTLDYDPINDFNIIGPISTAPIIISVKSESKLNTITDFLNESKTKKMTCGAAGLFTTLYINHLLEHNNAKDVVVATYKSTPQPTMDVISGNIDCFVAVPNSVKDRSELKILKDDTKDKSMKFVSFTAIAIGKDTPEETQIKSVMVEMLSDAEYVDSMKQKGFDVPKKINFEMSKSIDSEYDFLNKYNSKHKIIEIVK